MFCFYEHDYYNYIWFFYSENDETEDEEDEDDEEWVANKNIRVRNLKSKNKIFASE